MTSCRHDVVVFPPEVVEVGEKMDNEVRGFYLLNEGNMGSNKATLDYYDFPSATYTRNNYAFANPNVPKELGDVGNDLAIYGSKLYAVINVSNKVEVMSAATGVRLGQVDIPNCRYLCFHDRYAYVTSYAGPVIVDPEYKQIGYVAKIDTATLQVVDTCHVGFQPDGLAIVGNKLYVANSGGYLVPNYENTLSVIDLTTFEHTARIPVAINLHRVCADNHGGLWVSSRGDYMTVPSRLYYVDTALGAMTDSVDIAVSDMCLMGDSLYVIGSSFSYLTHQNETNYGIVNTRTHELVTQHFITDGTEEDIVMPYGIAVHPLTHHIYVTDATNYFTPGYLHCYSPEGIHLWSVRAGDIPAHFAFIYRTH